MKRRFRTRGAAGTELYSITPWPASISDLAQALPGEVGLVARGVLTDHVLELDDTLRPLAELQVGVALFEERTGELFAFGVPAEHGVELLDGLPEAPLAVVGLAGPVDRVVRQVGVGEVRQVLLEFPGGQVVVALQIIVVGRIVKGLGIGSAPAP